MEKSTYTKADCKCKIVFQLGYLKCIRMRKQRVICEVQDGK